jgi:hypothetical protein
MQEKRAAPLVLLLCAMQGGCYLYLLSLGRLNEHMLSCQTAFFTAFALYAACLVLLSRADNAAAGGRSFLQGRGLLVAVLFFSVMFRCIVWFGEPALSDDIYRYVWEGRLSAAGINPFAYAPEHSGLMQFRDTGIFPHINNKHLPTIYPPLSQFIFALSAGISPTVGTMKAAFAFFDLATIAVLLMTLRALNLNLLQAAVYALNPLVIMEFAGSGHLDSAGIFFLMLALYCCIRKKTLPAVAAL